MAPVDRECEAVVIGAGYAGLHAARHLARAGVDVLVLEARDRVGGRVWTETTASGAVVDHGGQWTGPGQHLLQSLADEFNVDTFPTYTKGQSVEWRDGQRNRYSGLVPTSDVKAAADGVEAIFELDLASREVSLDTPWAARDATVLDGQTLGSWLGANVGPPAARSMIATAAKSIFGAEPGEISLLFTLFYLHAGGGFMNLSRTTGGAQERRFAGGAQQMALRLADELGERVVVSSPAVAVDMDADAVQVTVEADRLDDAGSSRWRVRARRAVVAMAPGMAARLRWSPPLPPARDQLSQRAPMGSVTKVHAVYDHPFWRDEGLNGQVVSDEGALRVTFDDSPEDASRGILVGFVAGNECRLLDAASEADRRTAVLQDLVRYFGERAGAPVELVEQRWSAEPYTRGGPVAVFSPGLLTGFGPALRAPVGPVHWAGTETAPEWCGYIDGALSSGARAAGEVLAALGR